jgi:hypothetical protein
LFLLWNILSDFGLRKIFLLLFLNVFLVLLFLFFLILVLILQLSTATIAFNVLLGDSWETETSLAGIDRVRVVRDHDLAQS